MRTAIGILVFSFVFGGAYLIDLVKGCSHEPKCITINSLVAVLGVVIYLWATKNHCHCPNEQREWQSKNPSAFTDR